MILLSTCNYLNLLQRVESLEKQWPAAKSEYDEMELTEFRPRNTGGGSNGSKKDVSGSAPADPGSGRRQSSWSPALHLPFRRGSRPLFHQRSDTTTKQTPTEGKRVSFLAVYEVIDCKLACMT